MSLTASGRRSAGMLIGGFAGLALLVSGCAPAREPASQGPDGSAGSGRTTPLKALRMGMSADEEPTTGISLFGPGGTGAPEHTFMLHAGLTIYDGQGNLLPLVAEKIPSTDDGDWQVFPDGRMEVTWKLRPGAKWHDGTPLTAEDYVFGMQAALDDEIPHRRGREMKFISNVAAPDPQTVVVSWKKPFMLANVSGPRDILALPRHLAASLYQQDKQAFINSALWTQEFVGLGPYRMSSWVFGSQMELLAFEQFFLGKPKIERILIRYFGDANTLNVSLLSGDIDVVPMGSLKPEPLQALRKAWEPTGAGTVLAIYSGTRNVRFQYRDANAPWARDRRVRQALYHMLDRQTLADTLQYGLTTVAHTIPGPDDPVYRLLEERGLATYPFDLARAQRLLADAGWARASDGTYRSAAGQPFTIDVRSSDKAGNVEEGLAVAGMWNDAGVRAEAKTFPLTAANVDEIRATFPGVLGWPMKFTPDVLQDLITAQIPTENTRWKGTNYGAHSDPVFDALYDRYISTLQVAQRRSILADLLKLEADQATSIHLYYNISTNTLAVRKGVRGPGNSPAFQLITTWNIHTWEMD